ncbi:MAG: hypothetical protein WC932_05535 [archaeon]|jgi:hypothetical protein
MDKLKSISPIIATVLLIIVTVIIVTIILSFGKGFTTTSLDKTKAIKELTVSDAGVFVYPKSFSDGVLQINYQPPNNIQEPIIITSYKILEVSDMEPVTLSTPFTLTNNSTNILSLDCLYEYSVENPEMTIELITSDNTYITVKQRDIGMVCSSGGTGTEIDPIIICNAEDLNNVRNHLDYNYSLEKDVDLKCFSRLDVNGWEPIGNTTDKFRGLFNGNNYTISNLYINRPETNYIGLFGMTDTEINVNDSQPTKIHMQNIFLKDVNVIGKYYVGGLLGRTYYTDNFEVYNWPFNFFNCNVTGNVYGLANVGGLIGENYLSDNYKMYGGKIQNSNFNGTASATATWSAVGGLVGRNAGYLLNNYSTGNVTGINRVGGLIGDHGSNLIEKCYSNSSVSGTNNVGGLVGEQNMDSYDLSKGRIYNCYSLGSVSGTNNVGGLIGLNQVSTVSYSYSTGSVSGTTNVGGLVGINGLDESYEELGTTTNSYYDTTISGQSDNDGRGVPKTTTEMKTQSTFTGWNFSTIWNIDPSINSGYPYLR